MLLDFVRWQGNFSTVENLGTLLNCFQSKKSAAMSFEQRTDGRGFQQSGHNANCRNEKSGSGLNETRVKTVHEKVMEVMHIIEKVVMIV